MEKIKEDSKHRVSYINIVLFIIVLILLCYNVVMYFIYFSWINTLRNDLINYVKTHQNIMNTTMRNNAPLDDMQSSIPTNLSDIIDEKLTNLKNIINNELSVIQLDINKTKNDLLVTINIIENQNNDFQILDNKFVLLRDLIFKHDVLYNILINSEYMQYIGAEENIFNSPFNIYDIFQPSNNTNTNGNCSDPIFYIRKDVNNQGFPIATIKSSVFNGTKAKIALDLNDVDVFLYGNKKLMEMLKGEEQLLQSITSVNNTLNNVDKHYNETIILLIEFVNSLQSDLEQSLASIQDLYEKITTNTTTK